ncbi:MAG TPA: glycosyltransferase family 4 protein [Steroidobacteraceae bacterium]|nr:glycosyltransferase family 4 protein [Steroidobacteraceae bacterium]
MIPALLWLIERLARDHDVRVFALRQEPRPAQWPLHGATIVNVGQPCAVLRAIAAIRRQHARTPFDLVHAFWGGACALAGVAAARSLRIPSLVHLAGGELVALRDIGYGGRQRLLRRVVDAWPLRRANLITAASEPIIAQAAALGFEAGRLPLGVDLASWPVLPPRARDSHSPARLIHVASLNRVKDQPTLLGALERLAARQVDFQLDVVGEDTLDGEIQRLARSRGLGARVTFHGFLTQRQLRPVMEAAHINLVSSRHEAGPLVVLEAAVAGVPTVGTAVGHVREWANDAAICVPVGDDAAFALGVLRLLEDDAERMRLAVEAQRRAIVEDADFTARSFDACYLQLVTARCRRDVAGR